MYFCFVLPLDPFPFGLNPQPERNEVHVELINKLFENGTNMVVLFTTRLDFNNHHADLDIYQTFTMISQNLSFKAHYMFEFSVS